jgi:polysaccharide biosynthesis protein PslH
VKLLWVKSDFLHPTTRGGQIRTLEMLRRLHARHEVHYLAFENPNEPEGLARSREYCSQPWPVPHSVPPRRSLAFARTLMEGLVSPMPVAVLNYRSAAMREKYRELVKQHRFDCIVCDFIFPAPNVTDLSQCVLFQHNVEAAIWERHTRNAPSPAHRAYFAMQFRKMLAYEGDVCRKSRRVIAVSENDAERMRRMYGVKNVSPVPTGVDIDYFARPDTAAPFGDIVFVGSMDWMPNNDGVLWFLREVLPLIRAGMPGVTLGIVGRKPGQAILDYRQSSDRIQVTGTVPDVRPYLWGSSISVTPLRIGGGTRLKIYESMAAGVPVVSTTIGAEGLDATPGEHIVIGDRPEDFAGACLGLLKDPQRRARIAEAAWQHVCRNCSWDTITESFERLLAN